MPCTVKKTVESIHRQQQHYLIALTGNQPTLERLLTPLHHTESAICYAEQVEHTHGRQVRRQAWVYQAPNEVQQRWAGLKSLIWVEREGLRNNTVFHEQGGDISSLDLCADEFLYHIQPHWGIENRLHWVRDVTFDEDWVRPGGHAPVIWAILNCFLMSIVRQLGFPTVPQGVRALTNQVKWVYQLLTHGFSSA